MSRENDIIAGNYINNLVEALLTKIKDSLATLATSFAAGLALIAGEAHIGEVGGPLSNPSANFTRPADTTPYTSGDLAANSVTAGSVVPMSWAAARIAAGSFMVRRARLQKSGTGVTAASFRLHLYTASPTCTNGDNAAWLTTLSGYIGAIDITVDRAFSDGAAGSGAPVTGSEHNVKLAAGQTIYGLLEVRGAYTPANAEVFTIVLELLQN